MFLSPRSRAAILAGSAAGAVDIGAAVLINRQGLFIILQSIASGLLGLKAYSGGLRTMVLGLALHFAMSIAIASLYALAATRSEWLVRRPVSAGLAYGLGIYLVMNFVIVPLSAFAPRPTHISLLWLVLNLGAMLIFGVIVATMISRQLGRTFAIAWVPSPSRQEAISHKEIP